MIYEIFREADTKCDEAADAILLYLRLDTKNHTFTELFGSIDTLEGTCSFEDLENFKKRRKRRPGVYLFIAVRPFIIGQRELQIYNSLKGANIKQKEPVKVKTGRIFYVGSSSNIAGRIHAHYNTQSGNSSLHLDRKERRIAAENVRAYIFTFRRRFDNFSRDLMRIIERKLHERCQPVAGIFR